MEHEFEKNQIKIAESTLQAATQELYAAIKEFQQQSKALFQEKKEFINANFAVLELSDDARKYVLQF